MDVFQSLVCLSVQSDYLISRAEAALGSVDKVKKGHADYVRDMGGEFVVTYLRLQSFDDIRLFDQSINVLLFLKH